MRKQFTFYRSFWEAVKGLEDRDRLSALDAFCAYALDGEERDMTPTAAGMFILVKPVLDSAALKSEGGKKRSTKKEDTDKIKERYSEDTNKIPERYPEDYRKEKEGEKEKEKEKEIEIEVEREKESSRAMAFFLDRINPSPSSTLVRELLDYIEELSDDVVLHALEIANDSGKASWNYIKAILNRYRAEGLKTVDAVLRSEQSYRKPVEMKKIPEVSEEEKRRRNDRAIDQILRLQEKMRAADGQSVS